MEDENARMAAMKAKFEEEIAQLRESNKTMREAAAEREATAMGTGAAAAARQGPGGQGVSSVNDSLMRLHYSTRSPPKMPNDPAKTLSWIRRFEMFLVSENLKHILTTIPSTGPVDVISCNDRFFLERIHGVQTVGDNWKVWQHLLEATCNTDIEEKLAACNSVYEAWGVVTEWTLPASEAEKTLLSQQLENVKMYSDEDPKTFFIRVDKLVNMMRRVGITKTESQIVHIIVRQLSDEYTVQRAIIDANPDEYPRVRVEQLIRNAFANRKVKAVMQSNVPSPAAQRDPHALAFGEGTFDCITAFTLRLANALRMSCSTLTRGYSSGFASMIALCTVYSSESCRTIMCTICDSVLVIPTLRIMFTSLSTRIKNVLGSSSEYILTFSNCWERRVFSASDAGNVHSVTTPQAS